MNCPDPTSSTQAADRAFERLVEAAELGIEPDLQAIASEVGTAEADRLWALAQELCTIRPEEPPTIAGYDILARLGRGGMGTVYLAREEALGGRAVALKVLPAWAHLSRSLRARFESESAGVARLRHPHVIMVHRVISSASVSGFTMEWIDGGTLAQLIGAGGPDLADERGRFAVPFLDRLDGAWAEGGHLRYIARVGRAVAEALAAVHEAGLLHRDVKPSNVLLRATGEPVLSDFGLVRELGATVHTQTGQFVGTTSYAAPEQLRGEELDQRADVFGLGVTLYHALSGRLPWPTSAAFRMAREIESSPPPRLRPLNPRVSRDLETIVQKAIRADPGSRYRTAGELADDLDRFLTDRPIRARRIGPVGRATRFARRHRGPAAAGLIGGAFAAVLALLLVLVWFVLPAWSEAELRAARGRLLEGNPNLVVYSTLYWNPSPEGAATFDRISNLGDESLRAMQEALERYTLSARLNPLNESAAHERDACRLALDLSIGSRSGVEAARSYEDRWTTLAAYLRSLGDNRVIHMLPRRPPDVSISDAAEARTLGLVAFFIGDMATAIEAWTRLDRVGEADPLVDGLIGELYLALDEHALAYPRVRSALEAYGETPSLRLAVAEAAIGVRDFARAERHLESIEGGDAGRLRRLRVELAMARDDQETARALFEQEVRRFFEKPSRNDVILFEFADWLLQRGEVHRALAVWSLGVDKQWIEMWNARPIRHIRTHVDQWLKSMPTDELRARLTESVERLARDPETTIELSVPASFEQAGDALRLVRMGVLAGPELERRPPLAMFDPRRAEGEVQEEAGVPPCPLAGAIHRAVGLDDPGRWRAVPGLSESARRAEVARAVEDAMAAVAALLVAAE